jgi:putative transposase
LAVFIEKFLCPQLWAEAVVVMDNLPAPKLASILPMITDVGASIICLSPEMVNSDTKLYISKYSKTK